MGPVINDRGARSLQQAHRTKLRRGGRSWSAASGSGGDLFDRGPYVAADRRHRPADRSPDQPRRAVPAVPQRAAVRRSRRGDRRRQPQRVRPDRRHLHAGQGRARPLPRTRSRPACFTPTARAGRRPAPGPASRPSAAGRGRGRPARAGSAAGTSRNSCASRATPCSGRCEQALRFPTRRARRAAARRHDDHVGRLRPGRQSRKPDPRDQGVGGQGPDGHFQQCRGGRLRPVAPAREPPDPQDDLVLHRREQVVRAAISGGRAGARAQSAGHAGRADQGGRRGHPRLLTRGPGSARSSPRASRRRSSTARPMSARPGCGPTSRSSRRGARTPRAISSSARPRATSIR